MSKVFNEHVLLMHEHSGGALYSARAVEESVMLRISHAQRQAMQWSEPHLAYQLVLSIFRQADLRQPHRRHATHMAPINALPHQRAAQVNALPAQKLKKGGGRAAGSGHGPIGTAGDAKERSREGGLDGGVPNGGGGGGGEGGGGGGGSGGGGSAACEGRQGGGGDALQTRVVDHRSLALDLSCDGGADENSGAGGGSGGGGGGGGRSGGGGAEWFSSLMGNLTPTANEASKKHAKIADEFTGGPAGHAAGRDGGASASGACPSIGGGGGDGPSIAEDGMSSALATPPSLCKGPPQPPSASAPGTRSNLTSSLSTKRGWAFVSSKTTRELVHGATTPGGGGGSSSALSTPAGNSRRTANRVALGARLKDKDSKFIQVLRLALDAEEAARDVISRAASRVGRTPQPAVEAPTSLGDEALMRQLPTAQPLPQHAELEQAHADFSHAGRGQANEISHPLSRDAIRARVCHGPEHHGHRAEYDQRDLHLVDADFLNGNDFRVELTRKQREHYELIYLLNDHSTEGAGGGGVGGEGRVAYGGGAANGEGSGPGEMRVEELSRYMESLGHGVPASELVLMMHEVGLAHVAEVMSAHALHHTDALSVASALCGWRTPALRPSPLSTDLLTSHPHPLPHATAQGGRISKSDFLEFMRKTIVADLPSSKLVTVRAKFKQAVAGGGVTPASRLPSIVSARGNASTTNAGSPTVSESRGVGLVSSPLGLRSSDGGGGESSDAKHRHKGFGGEHNAAVISKASAETLLHELGCELDEQSYAEIFDECDSDGDGTITVEEFITALGMLKRNVLEVMQLEQSFTRMRAHRLAQADGGIAGAGGTARPPPPRHQLTHGGKTTVQLVAAPLNEHAVYASDLVHCLGITGAEAEEMIFIADLKDDPRDVEPSIDFTEFKQVVVNWSN